ncbi:tyrosine-type recombinase/integrase [Bifidobacterium dentium]|nr:tyrosine-type recombinase/integrase [Bifidobacterium dentium]
MRHTAATEWLRHGIDVLTVKEWLGHSSLAMTQRYVHYLGTDADIAAIKKLNR